MALLLGDPSSSDLDLLRSRLSILFNSLSISTFYFGMSFIYYYRASITSFALLSERSYCSENFGTSFLLAAFDFSIRSSLAFSNSLLRCLAYSICSLLTAVSFDKVGSLCTTSWELFILTFLNLAAPLLVTVYYSASSSTSSSNDNRFLFFTTCGFSYSISLCF